MATYEQHLERYRSVVRAQPGTEAVLLELQLQSAGRFYTQLAPSSDATYLYIKPFAGLGADWREKFPGANIWWRQWQGNWVVLLFNLDSQKPGMEEFKTFTDLADAFRYARQELKKCSVPLPTKAQLDYFRRFRPVSSLTPSEGSLRSDAEWAADYDASMDAELRRDSLGMDLHEELSESIPDEPYFY